MRPALHKSKKGMSVTFSIAKVTEKQRRCMEVACKRGRAIRVNERALCMKVKTMRSSHDPPGYDPPIQFFFKHLTCSRSNLAKEAIEAAGGRIEDVPGFVELNKADQQFVRGELEGAAKRAAARK